MTDKIELEWYSFLYHNVHKLSILFELSDVTIVKYMKRYKIKINKGFYSKGKKIGRPGGFKHTNEFKETHRIRMTGERNPFYGKKHDEKTKKKMRGERPSICGDNNPFKKSLKNKKNYEAFLKRCKTMWENRDNKWRKAFSEKLSKAMTESENYKKPEFHKNHKSDFLYTKKAGKIFYRSSWEKRVAEKLDTLDCVKLFSLEQFVIEYINNKNEKRFSRIDFSIVLTNGIMVIAEVKPKALQKIDSNPEKIQGYINFCKNNDAIFMLIDEDNLNSFDKELICYMN